MGGSWIWLTARKQNQAANASSPMPAFAVLPTR